MKKSEFKNRLKGEKESSESIFSLVYYFAKDWMQPSPEHPLALQILIFILKLPVLILFLIFSPIIMLVLFITFIVGF